jgi:NADH:ubiquinone oxidoreductase subunit 6 (subunit J)
MAFFTPQAAFYYMAAASVASALLAVTRKNPVHSMLWVLALFLHVAGIFLLLGAEFLAAVQVIVYAGAILVFYIFVLMLLDLPGEEARPRFGPHWPFAVAAGLSFAALVLLIPDTGGNVGTSVPLVVDTVPDRFAPSVTGINPPDGSVRGQNFPSIRVGFSEEMDEVTLTPANIQLIPKSDPGNPLLPVDIQIRNEGKLVQFTYDELLPDDYQIVINGHTVTDRAGNALGTTNITHSFTVVTAVAGVGHALFGPFALPFEIASLVLLAAIVGAVVLVKRRAAES